MKQANHAFEQRLKEILKDKFKGYKRYGAITGGLTGSTAGGTIGLIDTIKRQNSGEFDELSPLEKARAYITGVAAPAAVGLGLGATAGVPGGALLKNHNVNKTLKNMRNKIEVDMVADPYFAGKAENELKDLANRAMAHATVHHEGLDMMKVLKDTLTGNKAKTASVSSLNLAQFVQNLYFKKASVQKKEKTAAIMQDLVKPPGVSMESTLGKVPGVNSAVENKPLTTTLTEGAPKSPAPIELESSAMANPGKASSVNMGRPALQPNKPATMSRIPKVIRKSANALNNAPTAEVNPAMAAAKAMGSEGIGSAAKRIGVGFLPNSVNKPLLGALAGAPSKAYGLDDATQRWRAGQKGEAVVQAVGTTAGMMADYAAITGIGLPAAAILKGVDLGTTGALAHQDALVNNAKVLKQRQNFLKSRGPVGTIPGLDQQATPIQPAQPAPIIPGLALPKVGSCRSTGVFDCDGNEYVNGDDVELLGKLGFILDISEYGKLEKTSEVHDQYSYIEKIAGIPKAVVKAVDKGDAFSGEFLKDMDYSIPKGYEMKGDLCCPVEKKAAADPSQTILITGHSGSGKTTLSRQLAEKLNVPVRRVDAHRGWDNYIRGDDKRWKETLTPGTKEHSYFTELVHRATKDTLKNAPEAGIIEGTQLGHLSPEELAKFKAHIVVGGDRDQSILQRIQRSVDKASKNGITFSPEEMDTKRIKAKYVADFWEPGIEKFRKLPGVIHYNHTEHEIEPLIKRLQGLLQKKAELAKAGNVSKEAKGRCWEGYKPVKGKKPYSEDSCEPVAKKEAEYKWYKSKDLHRDVTNGRHYPFSYLTGEAKELVDAVKNRDMANFKEEIGDTSYAAQMLLAQATGLNHPVFADLSKFHDREKVWKDMFKEKGGTYHPKHMEGGSNYAKASKIIKAFQSAGIKVDQKEAERLANHYTGGKMEKEAGMPDWLRRAIRNNDKSTLSSAGKAGARVRARNLAAKKSKDELRRMLDMGAEAVPKIIHPPSAYNVQPPLPGI